MQLPQKYKENFEVSSEGRSTIYKLPDEQGSYMSGRVKFKDFSRAFKDMYQKMQVLQKRFSPLEIGKKWHWIVQNATSINFKQLWPLSDMNMQNQFNKMSVFECQAKYPETKSRRI